MFRKFLTFVLPSIASMWVFSLYSMVDGLFVARGVGEQALAAVNLSMPYVNAIFSLGLLFAFGTATVISIALGRKDKETANRYFNQNLVIVGVICILFSAVTLLNLDQVVRLLGGRNLTPATFGYVKHYVGTIAPFAIFFAISYNLEVQVKADGAPEVSTIGVISCAIMNILLDYVFVMHFHWDVWGAALATGIAQVTSTVIFVLYFLFRAKNLKFQPFRWELSVYKRSIPLGLPEGLNEISNAIVIFVFNHAVLTVLGEDKVTCYTIVSYVNTMALMSMTGTAQGLHPLASYYHGADDQKTCNTFLRYALIFAFCVGAAIFALVNLGAEVITAMFLEHTSSLFDYTVMALKRFSVSFLLIGLNVVMADFFTAMELPRYALTISTNRGLILLVMSIYFLAFVVGGDALWFSTTLSESLAMIFTLTFSYRFFRRAKKAPMQKDSLSQS